ncbi:MAG: hypothetical protein A2076_07485 [Geobacteraceae bacterium GWC2_53_11]|nr:MAG: hypothetical protein A2076_07485 [Geobacteraceae bacterium GWC2_53_11]
MKAKRDNKFSFQTPENNCEKVQSLSNAIRVAEEERARYEAFIAAIGDPITIIDDNFRILLQNTAFTEMMGEHTGELCYRAYHGFEMLCDGCLVVKSLRDGEIHHTEKEALRPDGTYHYQEFTVSPIKDAHGKVIAAIELFRDITERKQAELRLASQLAVSGILAESSSVEAAIPLVIESICRSIGWDLGGVWWVDQQENRLRLVDSWHKPEVNASGFVAASSARTFSIGEGLPGRVWESRQEAWIEDVLQDDNYPRKLFAAECGLRGAFAFPVTLGGAVVGVMEFYSQDVRTPDPAFLRVMTPLGSQLGQLIERKQAEKALRESERRFRETIENIHLIALELDCEGTIIFCNDFLLELSGWERNELIGINWFTRFILDGSDLLDRYENFIMTETMPTHYENYIRTRSGEHRCVAWNITVLYAADGSVSGTACIGEDITLRKFADDRLRYMSTHDAMTTLYNRAFFDEELRRLAQGRRFPVSIVMADVDGLKIVNDARGHEAGDMLIQLAARVLSEAFRIEDVVARIGGDEFAVLLPDTDEEAVERALDRIRKCCESANRVSGENSLSISLGAATAKTGLEISAVLKLSDERMYREKLTRKRGISPFSCAADSYGQLQELL